MIFHHFSYVFLINVFSIFLILVFRFTGQTTGHHEKTEWKDFSGHSTEDFRNFEGYSKEDFDTEVNKELHTTITILKKAKIDAEGNIKNLEDALAHPGNGLEVAVAEDLTRAYALSQRKEFFRTMFLV